MTKTPKTPKPKGEDATKRDIAQLTIRIGELNTENAELRAEAGKLRGRTIDLEKELGEAQARIGTDERLAATNMKLEAEVERLKTDLDHVRRDFRGAHERAVVHQQELRIELGEWKKSAENSARTAQEFAQKLRDASAELEQFKTVHKDQARAFGTETRALKAEIEKLKADSGLRVAEIERLSIALRAAERGTMARVRDWWHGHGRRRAM